MAPNVFRRTAVGLLVAAGVFAVIFYFVDAGAVAAALARADLALVALVPVLLVSWNLCWGVALWQVLGTQEVDIPLVHAVLYHAAAVFANHVTPLGQAGGEPVSAWIITRSSGTDYEVSLASIASFDALHVLPSLGLLAVGASAVLATGLGAENGVVLPMLGLIGAAVAVPLFLGVAWYYRRPVGRRIEGAVNWIVGGLLARLPGRSRPEFEVLETRVAGFANAIERIGTDRRRLSLALGFSALGWLFQSLGLWVSLLAVSTVVPVYVPLIAVPLGATGGGLPTPGGIGGKEAVYVATLTLLTSGDAVAITAAVAIHSTGGYLLSTTIGAGAISVLGQRRLIT